MCDKLIVGDEEMIKRLILSFYRFRLKTFTQSWPFGSQSSLSKQKMAAAGFFYLGVDDAVRCICCGKELDGWEEGDTPWAEHESHQLDCLLVERHKNGQLQNERVDYEYDSVYDFFILRNAIIHRFAKQELMRHLSDEQPSRSIEDLVDNE